MPDILIRNVPPETHRALKVRAALYGHSINSYILDLLAGDPGLDLVEMLKELDAGELEEDVLDEWQKAFEADKEG